VNVEFALNDHQNVLNDECNNSFYSFYSYGKSSSSDSYISCEEFSGFKILFWNINGLRAKLNDLTFFDYLNSFDIFFLVETWVEEGPLDRVVNNLRAFNLFWKPAFKLNKLGRAKEGMLLGFKSTFKSHFEFYSNNGVFGLCSMYENILILPFYCGPSVWESQFFTLSTELLQISEKMNIILLGDFNARIGNGNNDLYLNDAIDNIPNRQSKDLTCNGNGKKLLRFCDDFNFLVLNGRFNDFEGDFTFSNANGNSVIDYGLISRDLYNFVFDFHVENRLESDHFPLSLSVRLGLSSILTNNIDSIIPLVPKLCWKDQDVNVFNFKLSNKLQNMDWDGLSIDDRTTHLHSAISQCNTRNLNSRPGKRSPWFDKECLIARKLVFLKLNKFRNNRCNAIDFLSERKKYHALCRTKQKAYNETLLADFSNIKNSKAFWTTVRKFKNTGNLVSDSIQLDEWFYYFNNLLNPVDDFTSFTTVSNLCLDNFLDCSFTLTELKSSLRQLKLEKAPGLDGIPNEFFKYLNDDNLDYILSLFNTMYNNCKIPDAFCEAIIFPLHKKGDTAEISNFRGISFLPCLYKLFTQLLLFRMRIWAHRHKILHEAQAGFRRNYSTVDNIFVLNSIVEKHISKPKGKVFAFFIDFSAAFDSVNRQSLLYKLKVIGFSTKFINIIDEIYKVTKARVWTRKGYTNSFFSKSGVRQGCILSPDLFNFYLNDLADYIEIGGFYIDGVWIRILLYADDIVFLAEDERVLQLMIDKLANYCKLWDLKVNLSKSKIVVFRKKGKLKKAYEWFYNNQKIEIVNGYKYLGVYFKSGGSFVDHLTNQLRAAKIGLNTIYRSVFSMRTSTLSPFFKVFDAVSRSIMCYAAQVWGYSSYNEVELIQRFFIKKLLWLPYNTPNYMVLLETGREPLFLYTLKLHWAYLGHVLDLTDDRYARKIFNFGREHNLKWFVSLKTYADKYNMWNQFLPLNSCNFKRNINELFVLVQNDSRQDLLNQVLLAQYHIWYKEIKMTFGLECYLQNCCTLNEIRYIFKARSDMLPLNCKLWFPNSNHKCTLCNLKEDENLFHFIAICPILKEFRLRYLNFSYLDETQFIHVLDGLFGWKNLAYFVKSALSYRNELISEFNN